MENNLVIVESPAKAKTIEKFLGKDFLVKSSYGHIRDLAKKNLSINIAENFCPLYEIASDKTKVVNELRKLSQEAQVVWLASDEDREGEAIAWHLFEALGLKKENTRRIVFHEITKPAILNAITNPRNIDENLVNAQQARRILDRLVGYEISPILWKKVKPNLSAGRVQSVAVRLIVEREREIIAFKTISQYKISGIFKFKDKNGEEHLLKSELSKKFDTKEEAIEFLKKCANAEFSIANIETKAFKKSPAAPFTTSTLQQEASRKLNFSVSQTMLIAQTLYEAGFITYMRTDSLNLSETAVAAIANEVTQLFGENYSKPRVYKTKIKGAQEAHEAIRPTYVENQNIDGNVNEKKLYELIRKRTIASQMSDAQLEKTIVTIDISTTSEKFAATGEQVKFDGFMKLYTESTDEENIEENGILPPLSLQQKLLMDSISATEKFSHHLPRYTEASLVKKLEELGIGRPSTYAPTITTIQERGYIVKESREGTKREYFQLILKNKLIKEQTKTEVTGFEKFKLFPTDVGMVVNDFLIKHFENILDFHFTANIEKEFDQIAEGKLIWEKMIDKFYKKFHPKVEETLEISDRIGERILGIDPKTNREVFAKIGRFGPMVQIGKTQKGDSDEKPMYASLRKEQRVETITLEEALQLFELPKILGQHSKFGDITVGISKMGAYLKIENRYISLPKNEDPYSFTLEKAIELIDNTKFPRNLGEFQGKEVQVCLGKFGPYVKYGTLFASLKKNEEPLLVSLDRAVELIREKQEKESQKIIKMSFEHPDIAMIIGKYGPYISYKEKNYKIPKDFVPENLTFEECKNLIGDDFEKEVKKVRKTRAKK